MSRHAWKQTERAVAARLKGQRIPVTGIDRKRQPDRPIILSPSDVSRFWTKVEKADGCWIWKGTMLARLGYGLFSLHKKLARAHRVSWVIVNGPVPDGFMVCHTCDVRACVNPDHLFLGTAQDNVDDMIAKGRKRITSVLTEEQVRAILDKYEPMRVSMAALADEYGVHRNTIRTIVQGSGWKSIQRERKRRNHDVGHKLTSDDARNIRALAVLGFFQRDIAKHFNIAQAQVSRIVNGIRWAGAK